MTRRPTSLRKQTLDSSDTPSSSKTQPTDRPPPMSRKSSLSRMNAADGHPSTWSAFGRGRGGLPIRGRRLLVFQSEKLVVNAVVTCQYAIHCQVLIIAEFAR